MLEVEMFAEGVVKQIKDYLPEERLEIEIIKNEDETRSLKLHPIGEKYENYVREVTHD